MKLWRLLDQIWRRGNSPPATPEAAARLFLQNQPGMSLAWPWRRRRSSLRLAGSRPAPHGVLVLYTQTFPPPRPRRFGYVLVEPGSTGWGMTQASYGEVLVPAPLTFECAPLWQGGENRVLVFGYAADPAVQAIEVEFTPGLAGRDAPSGGLFAAVGPVFDADNQFASDIVAEVRAFDSQGRVVHRLRPEMIPRRSVARFQAFGPGAGGG